jgi:hypothetical protein
MKRREKGNEMRDSNAEEKSKKCKWNEKKTQEM